MAQITNEKTVLFIDGSNFYAAARSLGMDIDYARMRAHFARDARLIRAYYYTALPEDQEYSPLRPLIDWLDYNGYAVVSKLTREFTDPAKTKDWRYLLLHERRSYSKARSRPMQRRWAHNPARIKLTKYYDVDCSEQHTQEYEKELLWKVKSI